MLKRKIGIAVAGILLGAQIGLAAAAGIIGPQDAETARENAAPPLQSTYKQEHRDSVSAPSGNGNALFPADAEDIVAKSEPPLKSTFKQEHRDSVRAPSCNSAMFPADAEPLLD
jgi:hypothetical protein